MKLKSILVLALTLLCAMVLAGCDEQKQGKDKMNQFEPIF